MQTVYVILKVSERCNLACSYCYFFFGGDLSFEKHSPVIKEDSLSGIINFLKNGSIELGISNIEIILHGGEPLLIKKQLFDKMCSNLYRELENTNVKFTIQTNGLLIDSEWIELFSKHKIHVGISIDGPKEYHDKYRIDKKGRGSYDRTIMKIKQLQTAVSSKKIKLLGCLSVINLDFDPVIIYNHIIHDLEFNSLDLLLPDFTHDTFKQNASDYGTFLINLFDIWIHDNNPNITLRFCLSVMRLLMGKRTLLGDFSQNIQNSAAITISSDGDLFVDDTLRSTTFNFECQSKNIINTSLYSFINSKSLQDIAAATKNLPDFCKSCCWQNICNGGQLIHRYSSKNGFNNPSVYCEGLKLFYKHVSTTLIKHGINRKHIEENITRNIYADS